MAHMRRFESEHDGAQFGEHQPERRLPAEDAAFGEGVALRPALAGDDQHSAGAGTLRTGKKARQSEMGLVLRKPVQIDPGVDRLRAAREPLF